MTPFICDIDVSINYLYKRLTELSVCTISSINTQWTRDCRNEEWRDAKIDAYTILTVLFVNIWEIMCLNV